MMKTVETIQKMQELSKRLRKEGKSIGFVPTMGYLHEGHLTLVRKARESCDIVVASIFVNPMQFGPKEDLAKYPRDLERDSMLLEKEGTDILFYPDNAGMYPPGYQTHIEVERLTTTLCGASRPGHFRGVTTVVGKLFNIVAPDRAFFGEKDYQQLAAIRRMVIDLNFDIEVIGVPIIREGDGLAMSSRNAYLSAEERQSALCLHRSLREAQNMVSRGTRDTAALISKAESIIKAAPFTKIDYIRICDKDSLDYIEGVIEKDSLLALAVFVGATRLIDNIILEVPHV